MLNSPQGLLSATLLGLRELSPFTYTRAPLLPKLRGQFAEFLSGGSPVHLGTLMPAHLWRFAVRAPDLHRQRGFSRQCGVGRVGSGLPSPSPSPQLRRRICLPPSSPRGGDVPPLTRPTYPPASPLCLQPGGAGILTGYPSATPFGLALGPA